MRSQGNTLQLIFPYFTIDTAPDNFSFPCCSTTSPPHYTSLHRPNTVNMICNKVTLPRRSPRLSKTLQTTLQILRNEPLTPIPNYPTQPSVQNSTRQSPSIKSTQQRPTPPSSGRPNNFSVPTSSNTPALQNEPPSSIPKNVDTARTPHPTQNRDFSKIPCSNPTRSSVMKTNLQYSTSTLTPQVAPLTTSGPQVAIPVLVPRRPKILTSVIITHSQDLTPKSQLSLRTGNSNSNLHKSQLSTRTGTQQFSSRTVLERARTHVKNTSITTGG